MKRESFFYSLNMVVPPIMIAVLGVACFLVPWDGGERVTLMVTTLLTLTVYTVLVIENLPFGGSTPFLAKFILLMWCFAHGVFLLGILSIRIRLYMMQYSKIPLFISAMAWFLGYDLMKSMVFSTETVDSNKFKSPTAATAKEDDPRGIHTAALVFELEVNPANAGVAGEGESSDAAGRLSGGCSIPFFGNGAGSGATTEQQNGRLAPSADPSYEGLLERLVFSGRIESFGGFHGQDAMTFLRTGQFVDYCFSLISLTVFAIACLVQFHSD